MTTTGYTSITDIGQNNYTHQYDIEITDDFTHVRGRHTLQAGVDETGFKIYNPSGGYGPLGTFTFNGTWTGNGGWPGQPTSIGNTFADFLLGDATSATTGSATPDQNVYSRDWEFYGQDVWQVAPSLTVNYGLRYIYQSPWITKGNIATFFSFDQNKLVLAQDSGTPTPPPGTNPAQLTAYPFTTTQALGLPITFYQPDRNNFGPRVGFAWRLTQNNDTVLRGGYGVYYNFNSAYIGFSHNIQNPPWGGSVVYSSAKPSKPTAPFLPDITFNAPFPTSQAGAPAAHPTVYAMNSNFQNARIQQFNLTGEHQFRDNWKMRMSYVGNRTINLPITQYNTNIPAVQQPTQPLQNERPYQPWGPIQTTNNENISNTDQMQVEGLHQFSQGFLAQAQYQWTNCRDIAHPTGAGPAVVNQPRLDYGNCPYLSRHTFVANYVFDLPFGRDRHWLRTGVLSEVLGGWTVSGVTTYETGPPFSVMFVPPSTYPGWIASRANVIPGARVYTYNHAHSTDGSVAQPGCLRFAGARGSWVTHHATASGVPATGIMT